MNVDLGGGTHIHVDFSREERLARWVEKKYPLDQVERIQDQQVVLAIAATSDQAIEGRQQALGDIPLEALLQLEELAEGRVV